MEFLSAADKHIGRINLVDIRADLHTFGIEYPSSGQNVGFLRQRIKNDEIVIAIEGEDLSGFIVFEVFWKEKVCYIHQISVAPEYQRQGIATTLMEKAIERAKMKGCDIISLTTTLSAPWGVGLYQKLGFLQKELEDVHQEIQPYLQGGLVYQPETKGYFELRV